MARKDLPWQAEFNAEDKKLIRKWINENLSPFDSWGRPLLELVTPLEFRLFQIVPASHPARLDWPKFPCKVDPDLDPSRARRMLRILGLPEFFANEYEKCLRSARGARETEYAVFMDLWANLSEMGAGVNLHAILTADKESNKRWTASLKAARKTWKDVRLSTAAAAEIADALLSEIGKDMGPGGVEALRKRFERYTKKLFSKDKKP